MRTEPGRICENLAKLWRLMVDLIGKQDRVSMSADAKGDVYEGLLEKNAQDLKFDAGGG